MKEKPKTNKKKDTNMRETQNYTKRKGERETRGKKEGERECKREKEIIKTITTREKRRKERKKGKNII